MTHSTWLPGSTTLSQNEVNGLADETCQAKIKDLGSTQMCGSKISSSSNVMLVNYGYGGGVLNLLYCFASCPVGAPTSSYMCFAPQMA